MANSLKNNQEQAPATKTGERVPSWLLNKIVEKKSLSLKVLNWVIGLGLALILGFIIWGVSQSGFTITYDALGGTPVQSQRVKHGEILKEPNSTREGYVLEGWYSDQAYVYRFDFAKDTATDSMTLYAKWQKKPQK